MVKNVLQNSCELQDLLPTSNTAAVTNPFGMVLLQKQIANGGTTIQFLGLAQYPFTTYKIFISNFYFTASSPFLILQVSTSNGSPFLFSGYSSSLAAIGYGSSSWSGGSTISAGLPIFNAYVSTAVRCCECTIWNVNSAGTSCSCHGSGVSNIGSSTPSFDVYYGSYQTSSAAVNAIEFLSYNPASTSFYGTFALYGMN